jgi:outer membrane lipoprotein-sorting protein
MRRRIYRLMRLGIIPLLALSIAAAPPDSAVFKRAGTARAAEVLKQFDAARRQSATFSADVVETKYLSILKEPVVSRGHVDFAAPGKFRWELREPSRSLTICDGTQLWMHYPDFNETEHYVLSGSIGKTARQAIAPLLAAFASGAGEWQKHYDVGISEAPGWVLFELTPHDQAVREMVRSVRLWMEAASFKLHQMELTTAAGDRTVTEFSNVKLGEPIPDAAFQFSPPVKTK